MGTGNSVYLQTDKAVYLPGEMVTGTIYLNIETPVESDGLFLKITGLEETSWTETQHRPAHNHGHNNNGHGHGHGHNGGGGGGQETITIHHRGRSDFFKVWTAVVSAHGVVPVGQLSYPFSFQLPYNLPGVFYSNYGGAVARVAYKVKAVLRVLGLFKSNVKYTAPLNVQASPPNGGWVRPLLTDASSQVTVCCCCDKGVARLRASVDKDVYFPGESVQALVGVQNDSTKDIASIRVKLMQRLTLRSTLTAGIRTTEHAVATLSFPGVPAGVSNIDRPSAYALLLVDRASNSGIPPSVAGRLINCDYYVEVEATVSWGSNLRHDLPVTVIAPPIQQRYTAPPQGTHFVPQQAVQLQLPPVMPFQAAPSYQQGSMGSASAPPYAVPPPASPDAYVALK